MGMLDDPEVLPGTPPLSVKTASAPPAPAGWWEKDPVVGTTPQPRQAEGIGESFQAGVQASSMGLAWRGKLPDILGKEHESFWEGLAKGVGGLAGDIGPMIAGAAVGSVAGTAAGAAVTGPAAPIGGVAGGILGAGAGMGAVPAIIRESLSAAYRSGEIQTKQQWWDTVREAAKRVLIESGVSAATFGALGVTGRLTGRAIAPLIGEQLAVPLQAAGAKAAEVGAATATLASVNTAAMILAFPTIPALLDARLPDATELGHSAIIIVGLTLGHAGGAKLLDIFQKTGKTPAQVVADAQADPTIAADIARPPDVGPAPRTGQGTEPRSQMDLFKLKEPFKTGELPADEAATEAAKRDMPPEPLTPERATQYTDLAKQRLDDLTAKAETGQLTDTERAERIFLTNNAGRPDVIARRYDIAEPDVSRGTGITAEARAASAQRVHDEVLRQVREADQARKDAGLTPLGDDHATAVAAIVRARVRTRADRLGVLPEDIYNERPLQIVDEAAAAQAAAAAGIPADAPRFVPPEVDLFGNPIEEPPVPRLGVEGMATVEAPIANLVLSKEVPQFKRAANEQGVVVPLGGKFDRTGVGPIQVWERRDGTMEVISGRHRLDLARRSGETTIPAQIHREADGFTARQAAILDSELNIREEQGSVADYAQYFKASGLDKETAQSRGLLARAKGQAGFAIARDASGDVLAAHSAGLLSDDAALSIAQAAPGSDRLQALGVAVVNDGKSILMAVNMMKSVEMMAADKMARGDQGDMFGFDDSAMREAEAMAKKASSRQRKISEQISAVSGASRRPEIARKMGVDVQDPEGIQKKIVELKQEQYRWDNWPLYPELVAKLRGEDLMQGPGPDRFKDMNLSDLRTHMGEAHPDVTTRFAPDAKGIVQLLGINAKTERTGAGGRALEDFTAWLDANQVPSSLLASTEGDMPLAKLVAIYEKHGYTLGEHQPYEDARLMYRNPKEPARESTDRPEGDKQGADAARAGLAEAESTARIADYSLAPETPAELKARDAEGIAAARRKLAQDAAAARGKAVTADQADLFNTQNTLFQQHRGSYDVAENLIKIMSGADKSTVVHELGHSWLEELKADAGRKDAPEQIKADWTILRNELAIPEDGTIDRASHEQFARSVERYLADGEAPSIELRSVFERFKGWLLEIYNDLRNLNVEINPELRGVLDRMLATDQEIADAKELGVPRAYVPEAKAAEAAKIVPPQAENRKPDPGFIDEQLAIEPFAEELLIGPGSGATLDSRVNAQYINGPMDLKLAIQQVANRDQANIQQNRGGAGGVKSWDEANAAADKLIEETLGGKMASEALDSSPQAPPHDIQQRAAFKVMVAVAKHSLKLRDAILEKGDNATVQDQFDYLSSIVRMRMTHAEYLGLRAASARAMNQIRDMTPESGVVTRMVEQTGGAPEILFQAAKTEAQQAAELKTKLEEIMRVHFGGKSAHDIAKLQREITSLKGQLGFSKAVTDATKWEMVVEGWKAGLLSGPQTPVTNVLGTWSFQALRAPVDAVAALIGMARGASVGMGESDRASMSEALARITGPLSGIKEGLQLAGAALRVDEPTEKVETFRAAIPGRAGEVIRFPFRLMSAGDVLTTTMYKRGELKTLAIRQAADEGLNFGTREFGERVHALMEAPPEAMAAEADTASKRMAFNDPGGEKTVALQGFIGKWHLQWMIPFVRTPINIALEMARMSPIAPAVAAWRADIAKGGVARDKAIAEVVVGSGIMALTMAYAFEGTISGSGSPDPGKNKAKAGVWQPNSVLVGDTWYEIGRLQPAGTLMVLAADMAAVWDHMNDEERDKVPKMLAVAFSNAVTNQTFLQGITNVVNAMSDPTRFGPRFMQQLAGSAVPNIIGQPTTMADPVVRQVNSMLEAIQARIPGFRQDLLPKRDWLGAPTETKERTGLVMPIREQKVSDDKVRLEAARLDISVADAPKKTHIGKGTGKLGDVELTPEERDTFSKVGGEFAHGILTNIVNAPGYDEIPDLIKRRIFARVLTASHHMAAAAALPMDKRLAYVQSISEKLATELQPATE